MTNTESGVWRIIEDATSNEAEHLPAFLQRYICPGDRIFVAGDNRSTVLVRAGSRRPRDLLYARIGPVNSPKSKPQTGAWFVHASPANASSFGAIILSGESVTSHFYEAHRGSEAGNLYGVLGVRRDATAKDLRLAWRIHNVSYAADGNTNLRGQAERAFNILAHPELRPKYDAYLADPDSLLPFPYGGCGEILAAGNLSKDERTFFADSILAFKPEMRLKNEKVLLRQCEFLADRIVILDSRRKLEISMDAGILDSLAWDPTWNRWKPWLRARLEVRATFVRSAKHRLVRGEWIETTWWTALPSRISVTVPVSVSEDIARAQAIHELLGRHAELINRLREQISRQPVEASVVEAWLEGLGASAQLRPEYATWQPDYDESFFAQLRRRAKTWFLFRNEYIFLLPGAIVSEVPSAGHATYVFAAPTDLESFLRRYGIASRKDIRENKANIAAELGFIGRVVRGRKRKRWLADVLKLSGEHVDHLDAVED